MPPNDSDDPPTPHDRPIGEEGGRSDVELIAAAGSGDERAFDLLYRRHRAWVLALARRFTGHDADALDVLQETFVYVVSKLPRMTLTAGFRTFLYPAVRNLSLTAVRKRRRFIGDDAALLAAAHPEAASALADPSVPSEELVSALRSLSPADREAVLLRYLHDLTIPEIAAALGIPEGTVKSRLHHAIGRLRESPRVGDWLRGER